MAVQMPDSQEFNINFVEQVEKHPALYNFMLPEYSNRNAIDKAWHEVSMKVNCSGKYNFLYIHEV